MKPVWMTERHNPPHSYGDCIRACVASILEIDDVPHFAFDGTEDQDELRARFDDFLRGHDLTSWLIGYGDMPIDEFLSGIGTDNPGKNFIVFGAITSGEPHAVICRDGVQVHDPSPWQTGGLTGPHKDGYVIMTFVSEVVRYA